MSWGPLSGKDDGSDVPIADAPDAELVRRAREGDLRSFSALVERYQERMIRLAHSFLGNFEDARDVSQEAFVKAYERLESFREESRFSTWLYRIVANGCKDFLRKKKVRKLLFFGGAADEEAGESPFDPASDNPAPADALLDKELGAQIGQKLKKLPFRQRCAFTLRYLEGLSLEEIAESMGLSVGAVKSHLWHAAGKMRNELRTYVSGEEIL